MRITFISLGFSCLLACLPAAAQPTSAADGAPGAHVLASGEMTYYTQAGDTLSSIAQKITARSANWVALAQHNRIRQDSRIPIGTAIVIPANLLPDEPNEGKIIAFSGHVSAIAADGTAINIALGSTLYEGAQLETGGNSFLTLSLADQSRIAIPSNSRIKLSKLRMARYTRSPRTEVTLLQGRIEARVAPLGINKGRFEVQTPLSVTGVRGTHFRVALSPKHIANEVLSGGVAVSQPGASSPLLLGSGQGNLVGPNGVGRALNLLPAPQLSAAAPSVEGTVLQFDLQPLAGASAYQVQIATDSDAQNILTESRDAGSQLKVPGLPDGNYFARISAIDTAGLEGLSRTWKFTLPAERQAAAGRTDARPQKPRDKLPAPPGVPFVDNNDRDKLFLRWNAAPGQKSLIQIARDPAFSWLLLSTITETSEIRLTRPAFGTYYARAQTLYADGNASVFSLAQAFVVTDHWVIHDGAPFSVKEGPLRSGH